MTGCMDMKCCEIVILGRLDRMTLVLSLAPEMGSMEEGINQPS